MRHVLYVKKPLEMRCMKMLKVNVLLGDMKTSQFFTKEHVTIMTALMSMMTTREAIMLMMLMTMMQWQVKITMAYTHAWASAHVLCINMSAIEAY